MNKKSTLSLIGSLLALGTVSLVAPAQAEEIQILEITGANVFGVGPGEVDLSFGASAYFGNNVVDFINVDDINSTVPPTFPPELPPSLNPAPFSAGLSGVISESSSNFLEIGTFSTPAGSGILANDSELVGSIQPAELPDSPDLRSLLDNAVARDIILPDRLIINNETIPIDEIGNNGIQFLTWDVDKNGVYGNPGDVRFNFTEFTRNVSEEASGFSTTLSYKGELELIDPTGELTQAYQDELIANIEATGRYDEIKFTDGGVSNTIPMSTAIFTTQTISQNPNSLEVFRSAEEFNALESIGPETGTTQSTLSARVELESPATFEPVGEVVPEPGTIIGASFALGLGGLLKRGRNKKEQDSAKAKSR